MFESTIRYVGGLLSAYELSDRTFPVLLQKAKELADKLAFAWVEARLIPSTLLHQFLKLFDRTMMFRLDILISIRILRQSKMLVLIFAFHSLSDFGISRPTLPKQEL